MAQLSYQLMTISQVLKDIGELGDDEVNLSDGFAIVAYVSVALGIWMLRVALGLC